MSLNVTNCPKCGKLMMKGLRSLCPSCHQEIEIQYEKCLKYLRENRKCSFSELSEATGVSPSLITRFVHEGRISIADYANMSYQCEACGTLIREGNLCDPCRNRLVKDIRDMKEDERLRSNLQKAKEQTYLKSSD